VQALFIHDIFCLWMFLSTMRCRYMVGDGSRYPGTQPYGEARRSAGMSEFPVVKSKRHHSHTHTHCFVFVLWPLVMNVSLTRAAP
jgi:hypothetical protein